MAAFLGSKVFNILSVAANYSNIIASVTNDITKLADRKELFQNLNILNIDIFPNSEERYLNSREIIKKYGYDVEEYTVTSGSGYLLDLLRIPGRGPPVLLVHGIVSSSDTYLNTGKSSLAFVLADEHYDVWLFNARGNLYSRRHVYLSPEDPSFWKFSFHEIGIEDLPATIDFIQSKTNKKKLAYVGHSQGTTAAYVMLSKNTTYNDKLSVMISLAPIAWVSDMHSPAGQLLARFRRPLQAAAAALGINELFPDNALTRIIFKDIIGSSPFLSASFDCFVMLVLWGLDLKQIDYRNIQTQVGHFSAGSSVHQAYHYLQLTDEGGFREYDHGKLKNIEKYGSPYPPDYPVEKITCKMFFFYSRNDLLSSVTDVRKLTSRVQNVMGEYEYPRFSHIDYCWARDVHKLCYNKLVEVIKTANKV